MSYYIITAEHVSNLDKVVADIGHNNVMTFGKHPVFADQYQITFEGNAKLAEKAKNVVWENNHGAWCYIRMMTETELDNMGI